MTHTLDRRSFLAASAAALIACRPSGLAQPPLEDSMPTNTSKNAPMPHKGARMPLVFIGHGSPMNAIEDNRWSQAFSRLGRTLADVADKPSAVLMVSAHWATHGTWLTGDVKPKTIHDFGGFPQALFDQRYPAPGDPAFAARVATILGRDASALRTDWGLDHGAWTVLKFLLPNADVPVVQLSIDDDKSGTDQIELGKKLASLRDEGVLIVGSGNMTHNLRDAMNRMRTGNTTQVEWATRFDADVTKALEDRDLAFLARAHESDTGRLAHPTPDHYQPLLYVAGAVSAHDRVSYPVEGFDLGSLSMRSVLFS